jgi:hypothetical protein
MNCAALQPLPLNVLTSIPNICYLLDFVGLSSENCACHNDSHARGFTGDFPAPLPGGVCVSKCRLSDLIDFDGDFDRWLLAFPGELDLVPIPILAILPTYTKNQHELVRFVFLYFQVSSWAEEE